MPDADAAVDGQALSGMPEQESGVLDARRAPVPWWYRLGVGAALVLFLVAGLWGIDSPFIWGHYGYHAGFHGSNARTFLRHGIWTPAHYAGRLPPPAKTYYLHHPILMHHYLALAFRLFGEQEWVVRAVPLFFSLLGLLAAAWVTRRLLGPGPGVVAAWVFALLPQNLVFCHLIDHETPGLLYTFLAGGGLVLWLEQGRPRDGLVAVGAALLAGLTDWPPYEIAFFLALYGGGRLLEALPGRRMARSLFPYGLAGGLGAILLAGAVTWGFKRYLKLPETALYGFAAAVVCLVTTGLASGEIFGQDRAGPRRVWHRFWPLAVWSLALLAALAFHVWYTRHVGAWEDLHQAFRHRSQGGFTPGAWKHYKEGILALMFTKPLVWLGWAWLAAYPLRLLWGRASGLQALALSFAAGQVLHNLKFPNEIAMHNYRAYYLVGFFVLATADTIALLGHLARRLRRRLEGSRRRGRGTWNGWARTWGARGVGLLPFVAAVGLLGWQAKEAWGPWRQSRPMGGTLTFKNYRSFRHEILFFREVSRITPPDAFVFIHSSLSPRFEGLYYLDRDYEKVGWLPQDRQTARRKAGYYLWRRYQPRRKPRSRLLARLRRILRIRRRPTRPRSRPKPTRRPLVAVARLTDKRALRQVARLAAQHEVVIYHPFAVVFYDRPGPRVTAYRFAAVPEQGLAKYLRWRGKRIVFRRDPGLERHWEKRFREALGARRARPRRARRTRGRGPRLLPRPQRGPSARRAPPGLSGGGPRAVPAGRRPRPRPDRGRGAGP